MSNPIAEQARRTDFVHAVILGKAPPMPRPRAVLVPTMSTKAALAVAHRAYHLRQLYAVFRANIYSGGHGSPIERWKREARLELESAKIDAGYQGRPILGKGEPIDVLILQVWPLAKSHHRVRNPKPRKWQTAAIAGDWENVGKPVCDAATGILWHDDAQIARGMVEQVVAAQGELARLEIIARPLWDSPKRTRFEAERDALIL